jgi:hypothetical protein
LKGIWESLGAEAGGQSPEDMGKFVDGEIAKWAKVVKDSGAMLDCLENAPRRLSDRGVSGYLH